MTGARLLVVGNLVEGLDGLWRDDNALPDEGARDIPPLSKGLRVDGLEAVFDFAGGKLEPGLETGVFDGVRVCCVELLEIGLSDWLRNPEFGWLLEKGRC
jgi:hypothetical protein